MSNELRDGDLKTVENWANAIEAQGLVESAALLRRVLNAARSADVQRGGVAFGPWANFQVNDDTPKGFACATCGKFHEFSGWVYAHWRERLTHTCECGARYSICRGRAIQTKRGKKPHGDAQKGEAS